VASSRAPTMLELVVRLAELGCDIRSLSGEIVTLDGMASIRHAYNPRNRRFMVLPMLEDHEIVSPWVVGNIKRRLGAETGFQSL
jgi:hypothetical protein